MTLPLVISIQSQVCYGHVGNSAAGFAMRSAGVELVEVPTALLSNHPRHPTVHGKSFEPEFIADLLQGLTERDLGRRASVILSGFMGKAGTAKVVADFVRGCKAVNPDLIYMCDPVMGDIDLGFFAAPELRAAFAEDLVPQADVIFPNAFELGALSQIEITSAEDVARAREAIGVKAVVCTSVLRPEAPGKIATVTATADSLDIAEVSALEVRPMGTGDLLGGLTAARVALGLPLPQAVTKAVGGVRAALKHTGRGHTSEMPITERIAEILRG